MAVYKAIDLLTLNTGLGYLGTNITGSDNAEARAIGLCGILNNQNNFGPAGIAEHGGYNLIGVNASNNNPTDALFAVFNVVHVHCMSNFLLGISDAQKAHSWVKAKKNCVLIVSYDASDISQNLLKEILGGSSGVPFTRSNTGAFPLANPVDSNRYSTSIGPSTSDSYTPVSTDFSLRNYDSFHDEISLNIDASKDITPILTGSSGGVVLGIDHSRKIVYWGDTDIGSSGTGTGGTTNNRINNDDEIINNDTPKLIANILTRMAEIVLYGE